MALVIPEDPDSYLRRRTVPLVLVHDGAPLRLGVTPGGGPPADPASTVRLALSDYLRILTGKRTSTQLFFTRKLTQIDGL